MTWAIWGYLIVDSKLLISVLPPVANPKSSVVEPVDPYSRLGPFGASFGPIGTLMATIAASGAFVAFLNDRRARRLEQFESNFFTLLATFESITSQASVFLGKVGDDRKFPFLYEPLSTTANRKVEREFTGRAGLRVILFALRDHITVDGYRDIKRVSLAYEKEFNKYVDLLGHYFRTLHHIFRLIDERGVSDKDYYARIARANLSNAELCLIAYNCIVGEGRFKFRKLAIKYSLLHNLHRKSLDRHAAAELDFFLRKLPDQAFRFEEFPPITYDD